MFWSTRYIANCAKLIQAEEGHGGDLFDVLNRLGYALKEMGYTPKMAARISAAVIGNQVYGNMSLQDALDGPLPPVRIVGEFDQQAFATAVDIGLITTD